MVYGASPSLLTSASCPASGTVTLSNCAVARANAYLAAYGTTGITFPRVRTPRAQEFDDHGHLHIQFYRTEFASLWTHQPEHQVKVPEFSERIIPCGNRISILRKSASYGTILPMWILYSVAQESCPALHLFVEQGQPRCFLARRTVTGLRFLPRTGPRWLIICCRTAKTARGAICWPTLVTDLCTYEACEDWRLAETTSARFAHHGLATPAPPPVAAAPPSPPPPPVEGANGEAVGDGGCLILSVR